MTLKVSVVVPVYNPGPSIGPCIDSMLHQSLSTTEYEAIFVDDGSTDDTPGLLDGVAREHPHIRVVHIPNSGWPGRPRNIGIAEARGEYIQFVDHDDWLAPDALEHLYEMGRRNRADIVIGKEASDFRGISMGVFRRDRETCTVHDSQIIYSLTPHKMFRAAFLRDHGIAFPEGRRRLEDQLFVVEAYFAAATISILASHVCYFYARRQDGSNAGSVAIDPAGYYGNVAEVIDVVLANTAPGERRIRLLRRFLSVEVLSRLSEPSYVRHEAPYRATLFAAARKVTIERIDPLVDARLGAVQRLRARFVRDDRPEDLLALAQRCATVEADSGASAVTFRRGVLTMDVQAGFVIGPSREPLRLPRADGGRALPSQLVEGLQVGALDVADEIEAMRADWYVRHRETGATWRIPSRSRVQSEVDERDPTAAMHPLVRARATLDLRRLGGRSVPEPGTWDLAVRLSGLGLTRRARSGHPLPGIEGPTFAPVSVGDGTTLITPSMDSDGVTLSIRTIAAGAIPAQAIRVPGVRRESPIRRALRGLARSRPGRAVLVRLPSGAKRAARDIRRRA